MPLKETEIPTPAVLIDLAVAKRNIERLAEYGRKHNLGIRPHTKTHKSARLARLQVAAGAVGLTVAKLGEADVMAEAGDDLLIAYPALDAHRAPRLANLAKTKTIRVGLDSAYAADAIGAAARSASTTIGILVDLDVGFHRTGVQSPQEALKLAQHISSTKGLRLDGIMCFPGQIKSPAAEQPAELAAINALLQETVDLFRRNGLDAKIVSGGSSPSAYQSHHLPALTEIRPGTYVYMDMNMVAGGFCSLDDCAARVVCTVVSDAVPGKVVLDAGSKTLTQDRRAYDRDTAGFGHILEYPVARIVRLSEEHGEVELGAGADGGSQKSEGRTEAPRPRLGQRVHVIPNHICPCINLHDRVYVRSPEGTYEPMPVDARGRVT